MRYNFACIHLLHLISLVIYSLEAICIKVPWIVLTVCFITCLAKFSKRLIVMFYLWKLIIVLKNQNVKNLNLNRDSQMILNIKHEIYNYTYSDLHTYIRLSGQPNSYIPPWTTTRWMLKLYPRSTNNHSSLVVYLSPVWVQLPSWNFVLLLPSTALDATPPQVVELWNAVLFRAMLMFSWSIQTCKYTQCDQCDYTRLSNVDGNAVHRRVVNPVNLLSQT